MNFNELVICERSPFWSIRLRRLLANSNTGLRETRTLEQCQSQLGHTKSCLAVMEIHDANLVAIWKWLRVQTSFSPHPNFVVVGRREMEPFNWSLREAGALQTVFSSRTVSQIAPILDRCRSRYQRDSEGLTSTSNIDLDAIWSNLPWS